MTPEMVALKNEIDLLHHKTMSVHFWKLPKEQALEVLTRLSELELEYKKRKGT